MLSPLEGVRVLNLGARWAGRVAALLLADQSADVIVVNAPNSPKRNENGLLGRNKVLPSFPHRGFDRIETIVEKLGSRLSFTPRDRRLRDIAGHDVSGPALQRRMIRDRTRRELRRLQFQATPHRCQEIPG